MALAPSLRLYPVCISSSKHLSTIKNPPAPASKNAVFVQEGRLHLLVKESPRRIHSKPQFEAEIQRKSEEEKEEGNSSGKLDKHNRLRSPRAARELSLSVLYAGFTTQVHPLKVLEARMQERRLPVAKEILAQYEHSPSGGEPIYVSTESEAKELESLQEEKANIDAAILTAHPFVVYNKFVLSLAHKIIKATSERWEEQQYVVNELLPSTWKDDECNGKLLETLIMHMAIAEIEIVGTSPKIVINEAVELAKRFCDGFAPRVVNGCLGNYFRSRRASSSMSPAAKSVQASLSASLNQSFGWRDEYED